MFASCNYVAGKPLWDFHVTQVEQVTTAEHALQCALEFEKSWSEACQLRDLASLVNPVSVDKWAHVARWTNDEPSFAKKAGQYATQLLAQRSGTLSKHSVGPYAYASLLDEFNVQGQYDCLQSMKQDLRLLTSLEVSRAEAATVLAEDLRMTCSTPLRLVLTAFEVSDFRICQETLPAQQILFSMLRTVPDSKVIEDVHQRLRSSQKARPNDRMSWSCVQQVCNHCNVLDSREIRHGPRMSKEVFIESLRSTRANFNAKRLRNPRSHESQDFENVWQDYEAQEMASSDRSCSHQISCCLELDQVLSFEQAGERWGCDQGQVE